MADAQVLQEYLIKLGVGVDEESQTKFVRWVHSSVRMIAKFAAETGAAAAGAVAGVAALSDEMEKLYFMSQRTGASVSGIQALGFAVRNLGGSAEGAREAMEGIANFLRSSPGAASVIAGLGVNPREDRSQMLVDLGKRFAQMPMYRAQVYARMMGIDTRTLIALRSGVGQYMQTYQQMQRQAGVNPQAVAGQAHGFMVQFRTMEAAFDVLRQKIVGALAGPAGDAVHQFTQMLVKNFSTITDAITWAIKTFISIGHEIGQLITAAREGFRTLESWFGGLSEKQQHTIKMVGLMIAAWYLLNRAFSASPIGKVIMLGAALLLLWQDYETWKKGGKSLIDWSKWEPDIEKAKKAIIWLIDHIQSIVTALGGWGNVMMALAAYTAGRWAIMMLKPFASIVLAAGRAVAAIGRIGWALATLDTGQAAAGFAGFLGKLALAVTRLTAIGTFLTILLTPTNDVTSERSDEQDFREYLKQGGNPQDWVPRGGTILQPGATDIGKAQRGRGQQLMKYFVGAGWSVAAAAGIVGNLERESGFNANAVGPGGHYGLEQMDATRRANFSKWLAAHGQNPDITKSTWLQQAQFINHELRTQGMEARTGSMLQTETDPGRAGREFGAFDERFMRNPYQPTDKDLQELQHRQDRARYWAQHYKPSAAPAPSSAPVVHNNQKVIHQHNNITVNGSSDPKKAAAEVKKHLDRLYPDVIRNGQGVVST